ncbi:hypothetical protein JHJ32_07715 [Parapedobacter sp. ISTM3]|uniref:hypothetical protein n=1 Tax=Parapedobacter sp. ISTM3 TaxID=2800130 RepID=UPI0019042792|nr:hypothetical protein [Parapedobacter sp. ISTM3]MBK1439865.1 hypothetical protein [Parapedobacter sp. ISTM3]
MEIELRRISHHPRVSMEAFAANLFINGTKAATVSNNGLGTQYYPVDKNGEKLVTEAEQYVKKLPGEQKLVDGRQQVVENTLGGHIDKLFAAYLAGIERKKFDKKVDVLAKRNIVIGEPGKYMRTIQTGTPIEMLLTGAGREVLTKLLSERAIPSLSENEAILNKNIPADILKNAGLTDGQMEQSEYKKNEIGAKKEETQKTKGKNARM